MIFLNPIWFFALAALSIPLVIHLWNIRPGKTLKVGSISLITEASKSNRRSLKLLDILLLLLRCLLLALLAAVLAAPVWRKADEARNAKGWLLIQKENLKETYTKFRPKADSLTAAGYEFHYFDKGFAKADLKKLLADTLLKDSAKNTANYWSLIKQLDTQAPAALPVYIFTPNSINHFNGDRPSVSMNLHWQTYTVADSTFKWIADARLTGSNNIKVKVGSSSPERISYTDQFIQNDGNAEVAVNVQNGKPTVSLKSGDQKAVSVDTSTLRIAIYADKYQLDADYLKAALNAVIKFSSRKAVVKEYSNASQIPGGQSWLFWLSDQPVGGLLNKSKHVFSYKAGKIISQNSRVNSGTIHALANGSGVVLYKYIAAKGSGESIWHDGFGHAILGLEGIGSTKVYHFYSHFNPSWNDLVWQDDFPKMMLQLIEGEGLAVPEGYDKRVLSNSQLQPTIVKEKVIITATTPSEQTDLSPYFWLLLVLIFVAERVVAYQKKGVQANG